MVSVLRRVWRGLFCDVKSSEHFLETERGGLACFQPLVPKTNRILAQKMRLVLLPKDQADHFHRCFSFAHLDSQDP